MLITATQFLLSSGCNKNKTTPCVFGGYSFAVASECTPQKNFYYLGDTIYLTSTFPKSLTNLINPSLVVNYSYSVGIHGDLRINIVDSIVRQTMPAKDSFDFISVTGTFSERLRNQGLNFNYFESTSVYEFKCAIVCRKKGLYGLGVVNLISMGIRGKNCTNAGFKMTVTNSDKHLTL